ncbi:MAG: S41 family peptidase [Saprospiraceae bacterium]|nr:S41 family peptidase [Saprospiraceae bacterium]
MKRLIKFSILAVVVALSVATTFQPNSNKYFEITKNIEIFANLYKELNTYYVDEIEPAQLMRVGIDAMVESLDPYTNYISESQIEGYRFITEGRYNGIGASSETIKDLITITELYEGQPADKAGLKVGDRILAIDGKVTKGKTQEDINNILRGFPGTEVELLIERPGKTVPFSVKLLRDEVEAKNIPYSGKIADHIGYINLSTFTRDAGANVADALRTLQGEDPDLKGVVLDLRGNGGGLLNEAVNIANVFIPKNELVVTTRGKVKEWDRSFKTLNVPVDTEIPLVILINNRSASASEIVSGVIQDYDRGVIIGQLSYGKGLVQNTRDIGYNAKVKLTTAKYYIPSGRCIQAVEYDNGEPIDIPESERTPFKTRNGRKVLDGGGVKPDLVIDRDGSSNVLKQLDKGHIIFDFVTNYCASKTQVDPVETLRFTDFDVFINYVAGRNFDYDTDTEKLITQLETKAKEEGFSLGVSLETVKQQIKSTKEQELTLFKDAIVDMIEKEIAGRYFYKKGSVQVGLRNDLEVQEAIKLLNDPARYQSMLKS